MKQIRSYINNTKSVILLLLLLGSTFPLISQSHETTLPEILTEAALNNPGLQSAFHQWKASLEKIPQVRALPNPQLTFGYFIREIETRVGPQQARVGFMQMFPWFGKLKLKGNAAMEAANVEKQKYEQLKLNLFYRVKEAWYDYYYISRTISILEENTRLLEFLGTVIESKYRTGTTSYSNLLKIQVEQDKLQNQLKSAVEAMGPIKARLNAAMNRPLDTPLQAPAEIPGETDFPPLSREHLVELLKENNPQLKSMDAMASMEQVNIKIAKKNYFPDFSIGVDYMLTGNARMAGVTDSGKDPAAAVVSFQLPVWGRKNKAAVREAETRFQAVTEQKNEEVNMLLSRLEMTLYKYNDAQRKAALYNGSLLPRTRQALEVTRSAFETGHANFMDLIDSQRTLLAVELEYEDARTRKAQRWAELEMLVGKDLIDLATKDTKDTKDMKD